MKDMAPDHGPAKETKPFPAWSDLATEQDIYYCYRLMLGREPDPGGLTTYTSTLAARPLPVRDLVEMFLTSLEFRQQHGNAVKAVPEKVDVQGFQLYASPDDWAVGKFIIQYRTHEPHVTAAMRQTVHSGMAVADIGANIGYFTMLAASLVGTSGRVYAFEPNPSNCTLIQLSLEANGFTHVDLFPFAVADKPRLVVLNSSASTGSTRPVLNMQELATSTVLRAVPVDDLLAGVKRLDVLKIDIDGGEGLAMRGAVKTLERLRPIIFTEFSPEALQNMSAVSGEDYLRFLQGLKYNFSVITYDEGIVACGSDIPKVMQYFYKARASHVDLLVTPK